MRNQAESTRRSGAIFGILKQMKETFESNLSSSQKEEMQSQAAYEDLKAAKESHSCCLSQNSSHPAFLWISSIF